MSDTRFQALTASQAVRAVGLFYDLLPGDQKLSLARIEIIAERLRDKAPVESLAVVEGIFAPAKDDARGELARLVLERFSQDEQLVGYVDQAIARATKADMAIDPLSLAAILVVLTISSATVEGKNWKYTGGLPAVLRELHVDEIAKQLPAIIKALPQSVLEKLGV